MTSAIATPVSSTTVPTPDFTAIKLRQQAAWSSGDYTAVGTTLQIVGETLAEAVDVRADERVLDVAAGNGNATLAAARRYANVISTDYVQLLLNKGRDRAAAENLSVRFEVADAESLPYANDSFDVALSTFGVMFAPDHTTAARELIRVVRPGGRIGMANWTPESFIGRLFKVIGAHIAPPAGVRSPALWGTEAHLVDLFGPRARYISVSLHNFHFRYRSAAHFLQVLRDFYGPTHKAFDALDPAGKATLEGDIITLMHEFDIGAGRGLVVPSQYAEIVITVA
jgi:SAM-dependent methyltransferase